MHAARCHGTRGQSLQCYGCLHVLAATDEPLTDRLCFRRAAKRRAAHLAVGSLRALSVTATVMALSGSGWQEREGPTGVPSRRQPPQPMRHDQPALEASAPAAFALDAGPLWPQHASRTGCSTHRPLTSRLSAFAQASPTALNTLHSVGPRPVLTCEPACPGRANRAKTASALSS